MDDSEGTPDQKTTLAKEEEEGGATVPASELAQEVVAEVIEEEVTAVPVSQEAQDASLELEQPEEREPEAPAAGVLEDLSSAAAAAVVPADGPPPANEEVVPVANAVAETSNACVEAEPLSSETAEESVPALNSLVSQAPRDGTELCRETEVVSATLLERRATWWNCCGLFDVLTGSRGNMSGRTHEDDKRRN